MGTPSFQLTKKHPDIGIASSAMSAFLLMRYRLFDIITKDGYPCGIKGEKIPLGSRIIAIADTYDAMTTDRPYRKRSCHEAAVTEIQKNSGTQFDTILVDVFMKIESIIKNIS